MIPTKQELINLTNNNLPDNTTQLINPFRIRQVFLNFIESLFGNVHTQNTDTGTDKTAFVIGTGTTTGAQRQLRAEGVQANIDLLLAGKGGGGILFGGAGGVGVVPLMVDQFGKVSRGVNIDIATMQFQYLLFISPNGSLWQLKVNDAGAVVVTAVGGLYPPTELIITQPGGVDSYRAAWNAVAGATSYVVRERLTLAETDPTHPEFTDYEVTQLFFERTLPPGWATHGSIQVAARDAGQTSAFSAPVAVVFGGNLIIL